MNAKDTFFPIKHTLNVGGRFISLNKPHIIGILNITPDSFFAGSRFNTEKEVLKQAQKMLDEGADFLDIGAYSSRPGAVDIVVEEELKRLLPAVKSIATTFPEALISVDTFRAEVAEAAVAEGAHMINDISGGMLDENMFAVIGRLQVPYVLMHMPGTPQTMQKKSMQNEHVILHILDFFMDKISVLKQHHVHDIIIDPGFGFGKSIEQNFLLLKNLETFRQTGFPVLAGLSRKSSIWKTLGITADEALNGTTALNMAALMNGASILRVHDVKEAVEAVKLFEKMKG